MVAVAVDRRVGDEVVEVRVVRERGGVDCRRVVVHELAKEAEGLGFRRDAAGRSRSAAPRTPSALWCSVAIARSSSVSTSVSGLACRQPGRGAPRRGARHRFAQPRAGVVRSLAPRRAAPGTARVVEVVRGGRSGRPRAAESPHSRPAARTARRRSDRSCASAGTDRRGSARRAAGAPPRTDGRAPARWACVSPS